MKNLSKALALVMLLVPGAVQAIGWCDGDNEHVWTYASGELPFTYLCAYPSWMTQNLANDLAQGECQQAWDNLPASTLNHLIGGFHLSAESFEVDSVNCSWHFWCRACVQGHLPYLSDHPARLGPAEAGHAATGAVKGEVLSVRLFGGGGDNPFYRVDVVTDTEQVQVEVDAVTGRARVVTPKDEGSCQP